MLKHGDGAGRSTYVLVLREYEEEGRGYSLELAPLSASDASPCAQGRASLKAILFMGVSHRTKSYSHIVAKEIIHTLANIETV